MKNITLDDLSMKMGLKLRNMGDLLGVKIVVKGPNEDTYGITIVSFHMQPTVCDLVLYGQLGETLTLRRITETAWTWTFQTPLIDDLVEVTNIDFNF